MKAFRQILFWCHLATGIAVGVIVFIMSATGVLLTYQKQMTAWADVRGLDGTAPVAGAQPLPTDSLLARLLQTHPGEVTGITWRNDPDAPVAVAYRRDRTLYVNAYTAAVLGEGAVFLRRFFRFVTDWHRYLGRSGDQRPLGKSITGAANVGFLFLVLSGLYLWWPRNWARGAVRNVVLFRRGLSGKARDFNWHNVLGLWSVVPLFLIVLSGSVISYRWVGGLVYRAVGETPPAPTPPAPPPPPAPTVIASGAPPGAAATTGSTTGAPRAPAPADSVRGAPTASAALPALEPLVARARAKLPGWRTIAMQFPRPEASRVVFTLDAGSGGQPQRRAQLTLDRASASELKWEPFSAGTLGRRLRTILRFTHTGEVLGLPGQTIAGLVSLAATLLVWTGIALAWRRLRAWQGRGQAA